MCAYIFVPCTSSHGHHQQPLVAVSFLGVGKLFVVTSTRQIKSVYEEHLATLTTVPKLQPYSRPIAFGPLVKGCSNGSIINVEGETTLWSVGN